MRRARSDTIQANQAVKAGHTSSATIEQTSGLPPPNRRPEPYVTPPPRAHRTTGAGGHPTAISTASSTAPAATGPTISQAHRTLGFPCDPAAFARASHRSRRSAMT